MLFHFILVDDKRQVIIIGLVVTARVVVNPVILELTVALESGVIQANLASDGTAVDVMIGQRSSQLARRDGTLPHDAAHHQAFVGSDACSARHPWSTTPLVHSVVVVDDSGVIAHYTTKREQLLRSRQGTTCRHIPEVGVASHQRTLGRGPVTNH